MWKIIQFQIIQFSLSKQFSSIWPIDRALLGSTAPGESGPENNDNEEVLCIPQSPNCRGSYISADMQTVYSTAPDNWGSL